MTYDLYDRKYKSPVIILEILKQEYPRPSDFMKAYQRLLATIRKDQEAKKQEFLKLVSQQLNIPSERVVQKGKELFRQLYENSEHERIARMEKTNEIFLKLQKDLGNMEITPFPKEIIEQEKASLPARIEKKAQEATDWDILNALRMNLKVSRIEAAMKDWENVWGFANTLEYEISKWPESAISVNGISDYLEFKATPDESRLSERKDLPYTNLTDVAVWQLENEIEIGKLTDEEFAKRYTYKRGHPINPKSLRAARNGTGLYKRSVIDIIEERKNHKRNSEK